MSKIGDILEVQLAEPDTEGFGAAPAIVTGVHEDGTLRMLVFDGTGGSATVRNYVDDNGEPHDYAPAEPVATEPGPQVSADVLAADVATVEDQAASLTADERSQLRATLDALDAAESSSSVTGATGATGAV